MQIVLAIALGIGIGLVVGAVGGGGAILALPVFVYVLGEGVSSASTASLIVVALGAAAGAGAHAAQGRVCWRVAASFAVPAAVGAYVGTIAGASVSPRILILAFVPVMLIAAVMTYVRGTQKVDQDDAQRNGCPQPELRRSGPSGLVVGLMTGFFGVGGGFLVVPALTSLLGLPLRRAIATSLAVIGFTGLAALAVHLGRGAEPDWPLTIALSGAAAVARFRAAPWAAEPPPPRWVAPSRSSSRFLRSPCSSTSSFWEARRADRTSAGPSGVCSGIAIAPRSQPPPRPEDRLSDELERWLNSDADKTLGGLIDLFGQRSFAVMFVLLLGVPALPLPTGGATHVFEAVAMLLALQLIANRDRIWLPRRWRGIDVGGPNRQRLTDALMKAVRRLERHSRPRLAFMFGHRLSNVAFGALALGGSLAAFFAPPFSGLDTLPALGVVLLSLGVLLEDFLVVIVGVVVGVVGVVLEVALGRLAIDALDELL